MISISELLDRYGYAAVLLGTFVEGETILQLHGKGPWTITYVNPADDPRK